MNSSLGASQSIISTKEVVLNKDISKERVTQVLSQAESMIKSERRPRKHEEVPNKKQ